VAAAAAVDVDEEENELMMGMENLDISGAAKRARRTSLINPVAGGGGLETAPLTTLAQPTPARLSSLSSPDEDGGGEDGIGGGGKGKGKGKGGNNINDGFG